MNDKFFETILYSGNTTGPMTVAWEGHTWANSIKPAPRVVPEVNTVEETYRVYVSDCPGPRPDGTPGVVVVEERIVSRASTRFPKATRSGEV